MISVDPRLGSLGRLVGLLTGSDEDVNFQTAWFEDPLTGLRSMPERMVEVSNLISEVLGPGIKDSPAVFDDATWYPLPDPSLDISTPFHLVAAAPASTSGQVGLGLLQSLELGTTLIEAFVYVPLFSYTPTGATFLPGDTAVPALVGFTASASETFTIGEVSFTEVVAEGELYLADKAPAFKIEFKNLAGTTKPSVYTSLAAVLDPDVESWLAEVVVQSGSWMQMYPGGTMMTIGDILTAAGFLTRQDDPTAPDADPGESATAPVYTLKLKGLQGGALEIVLNLFFAALDALASGDPLLEIPGGGIYVGFDEATGDYGVRVAAELTIDLGQAVSGQAPPTLALSLGTWLAGESDGSNWISLTTGSPAGDAGLSVLLLHRDPDTALSFTPHFILSSVGVSVKGGAGAPLVNAAGFTLTGLEVRALLDSHAWQWGVAAGLDGVGFPLGPGFDQAQSAGGNTVAQTLVATGNGSSSSNPSSPTAVNPAFSAEAAYVEGYPPLLEIFDPTGVKTDLIWYPMQRRFGPLECTKVGLKIDLGPQDSDPVLGIVFDGGVSVSALSITLDELSVSAHLKELTDTSGYDLDLQGMALTFNSGGVQISGGLMKVTTALGVEYNGEALIKFESFGLAAIGSFGELEGIGTSLFIFAWLNAPIGGPPFFCVTGLSAGFGYNRSLTIPGQDQVQQFPLVAGLSNPALVGGSPSNPTASPTPDAALAAIDTWVPPKHGEYFLAVGIQFTVFEVINANVLATIQFGRDLVIAVLGIATLKQPQVGKTFVYAELDVEVVFRPQQGEIRASAVLAPSSYLLDPQAHLTGGFAFCAWFGPNQYAGNWVITLGGYHPAFQVPSYYPQEPRVGINWMVGDNISVIGNAYFAMTPAAMMAGALLQFTFHSGPLKAWLKAQIDAIVFWKPFFFMAEVSISVGVSFHLHFLFVDTTLKVELGAKVDLWGPPVGFRVHVDWYVISFTISHGTPNPPSSISWDEFKGLLPSKTTQQPSGDSSDVLFAGQAGQVSPGGGGATAQPVYLNVVATGGLASQRQIDGINHWLMRAESCRFTITSALPATSIVVSGADISTTIPGQPVALRNVNGGQAQGTYQSTQTVTVLVLSSDETAYINASMATSALPCSVRPPAVTDPEFNLAGWQLQPVVSAMPKGMWGEPVGPGQSPPFDADSPSVAATTGVTLAPVGQTIINCTPEMVIAQIFQDRTVNDWQWQLSLSTSAEPADVPPAPGDSFADIAGINGDNASLARGQLFSALQELGVNGWTNDGLPRMAANPGLSFADEPMEGSVTTVGMILLPAGSGTNR